MILFLLIRYAISANIKGNQNKLREVALNLEPCILNSVTISGSIAGRANGYPSERGKAEILIIEDLILILSSANFPFIYRTYNYPIAFTPRPEYWKDRLILNRIFIPVTVIMPQWSDKMEIQFVDKSNWNTTVWTVFHNLNDYQKDKLKMIENWCQQSAQPIPVKRTSKSISPSTNFESWKKNAN